jgi:TRAP-type C4-dicarboxylate transport system substrate-binding protein
MRTTRTALLSLLLLLAVASMGSGLTIKLGSLAPIGSPWDLSLKRIAAEWLRISGGSVKTTIYAGGSIGDEPHMIRQMEIRQLHAAGLTVQGLNQIYPGFLAVSMPLLVRTDEELEYVLNKMMPRLEAGLEENGYKLIFWTSMGWVYFFSREPVVTPDDLRGQTLWVWEGNPEEASIWKDLNFDIASLPSTEILTSLNNNMIDAYASSPLTAAAYQWFALSPNMTDMAWGPLYGGLVVSLRAWNRIPKDLQPKLLDAARRVGESMREETTTADEKAIEVMTDYGLEINHVPDDVVEEWASLMERGFTRLVGKTVDREDLEAVKRYLAEFRD